MSKVWICPECNEIFDIQIWHCPICNHHWPMNNIECPNCHDFSRIGKPKKGLEPASHYYAFKTQVDIDQLDPNPYRKVSNYPINLEKVNETNFWDNILVRQAKGENR